MFVTNFVNHLNDSFQKYVREHGSCRGSVTFTHYINNAMSVSELLQAMIDYEHYHRSDADNSHIYIDSE